MCCSVMLASSESSLSPMSKSDGSIKPQANLQRLQEGCWALGGGGEELARLDLFTVHVYILFICVWVFFYLMFSVFSGHLYCQSIFTAVYFLFSVHFLCDFSEENISEPRPTLLNWFHFQVPAFLIHIVERTIFQDANLSRRVLKN